MQDKLHETITQLEEEKSLWLQKVVGIAGHVLKTFSVFFPEAFIWYGNFQCIWRKTLKTHHSKDSVCMLSKQKKKIYLKHICIYHFPVCKIATLIWFLGSCMQSIFKLINNCLNRHMFLVCSFCTLLAYSYFRKDHIKCSKKWKAPMPFSFAL